MYQTDLLLRLVYLDYLVIRSFLVTVTLGQVLKFEVMRHHQGWIFLWANWGRGGPRPKRGSELNFVMLVHFYKRLFFYWCTYVKWGRVRKRARATECAREERNKMNGRRWARREFGYGGYRGARGKMGRSYKSGARFGDGELVWDRYGNLEMWTTKRDVRINRVELYFPVSVFSSHITANFTHINGKFNLSQNSIFLAISMWNVLIKFIAIKSGYEL